MTSATMPTVLITALSVSSMLTNGKAKYTTNKTNTVIVEKTTPKEVVNIFAASSITSVL